jgi:hypothetical protein
MDGRGKENQPWRGNLQWLKELNQAMAEQAGRVQSANKEIRESLIEHIRRM